MAFFSALVAVYWNPAGDDINDASYYMDLAKNPLHFPRAPFGFRILTPYLVWLSHLPRVYAFTAVTVLSLAAASAFLYMYLREIYSPPVALLGVGLFVVCPAPLIELKNPVDVDSLFFAMVALAFYALALRRWALLVASLVIGVLDKETMLFMLLPLAVVALSDYGLKPFRRWAAVFGLPVLAYSLVHYTPLVFSPLPHNYNYLSTSNISFVFRAQHVINGAGPGYSFAWSMVDTFGALWVLSALLVWRAPRLVRQTAIFILPVLASVLIATDWSRMLAVGFIVIIPLVCAAGLRRPVATVVMFASYAAVVPLGLDDFGLHPSFTYFVPLLVVCGVSALVMAIPRSARVTVPSVAGVPAEVVVGPSARLAPIAAAVSAARVPLVAADVRTQAKRFLVARRAKRLSPAAPGRQPPHVTPTPALGQRPPIRVVPSPAAPQRPARRVPAAPAASVEPPARTEPAAGAPRSPEAPSRVAPTRKTLPGVKPTRETLPGVPAAPEVPPRVAPIPEARPIARPARVAATVPDASPERAPSSAPRAAARLRAEIPRATAGSAQTPVSTAAPSSTRPSSHAERPGVREVEVRMCGTGRAPDRVQIPAEVAAASAVTSGPPLRSEPVVHLENAEALLEDVQKLLANATARIASSERE